MSYTMTQNINGRRVFRFWALHRGSPIRLAIRPGQAINLFEGSRTGEGWFRAWTEYRLSETGEHLICESNEEHADCDGRFYRDWTGTHRVDCQRYSQDTDFPGINFPRFEEVPE